MVIETNDYDNMDKIEILFDIFGICLRKQKKKNSAHPVATPEFILLINWHNRHNRHADTTITNTRNNSISIEIF